MIRTEGSNNLIHGDRGYGTAGINNLIHGDRGYFSRIPIMADDQPPSKRHRRLPSLTSSFSRHLSNTKIPVGSKSKLQPKPEPEPNSSPTSSSSEDYDEEEEGDEEVLMYGEETTVQADFAFFDPKPGDFGSVKMLMNTYLDDYVWDVSGFVDLILQQTTVGSVIKLDDQEDDDGDVSEKNDDKEGDVFGVISALNLGRYTDHQCIRELKKYLLKSCTDKCTKEKLNLKLEGQASDVGLLVSQRFVNCPHQLVPPFYDALFDEVSWATEDEPTQELRDSFRFKFYLLITKIYEKKMVNKKVGGKPDQEEPIIYVKAEDEIFRELSLLSFTFDLHGEQECSRELKEYKPKGLVMVVKADDVPNFQTKIKSLLAEA